MINYVVRLFAHFNIHQLCDFFFLKLRTTWWYCFFAMADFWLPVRQCVRVIEGVGMLLRRWVYCDPAIFICVSGNYIEKVGLSPRRKRRNVPPYMLSGVYIRGRRGKVVMVAFSKCAIRIALMTQAS